MRYISWGAAVLIFLVTILYGWSAGLIGLAVYFAGSYIYYVTIGSRKEVNGERRKGVSGKSKTRNDT
jgi:hypothetical protein